ncbi:hypothetical protein MD483_22745, partial [Vibrio sp. DBSS07]|nr:hypothetical protein [Vibrio paucivorans]
MHPLNNGSQVENVPALKPRVGTPGYFSESNDNGAPSYPGQDWFNAVIQEFQTVLNDAGIDFDPAKFDHLSQAFSGKANASHKHNASDINSGTLAKERLPNASTTDKGASQLSNSYSGDSQTKSVTEKALSDGLNSHLKIGLSSLGLSDADFANNGSPEDIFNKMKQIPDALEQGQRLIMSVSTSASWANVRSCLPVDRQGIIEVIKMSDSYWRITYMVSGSNSSDRSRSYNLDGGSEYDSNYGVLWAQVVTDVRNPNFKTNVGCDATPTNAAHLTRKDYVDGLVNT